MAPRLHKRLRTVSAGLLSLLCSASLLADEPVIIANDAHEIRVVRVAKTDSLHDGMIQPPSAAEAFLVVYLETDDPCFDPARNLDCFGGNRDELETIAWACGEVEVSTEDVYPADGGGLLSGELACTYLIPLNASSLTLRLRGYPEIEVAPTG